MKVYIERNNIQVEIWFSKKCRLHSRLRLRGETVPGPHYVDSLFAIGHKQITIKLSIRQMAAPLATLTGVNASGLEIHFLWW